MEVLIGLLPKANEFAAGSLMGMANTLLTYIGQVNPSLVSNDKKVSSLQQTKPKTITFK